MFKLLSSKVKQKIQSDLISTEKSKSQANRLDLSGELKSDSAVLHTYGGESNTSQSNLWKKEQGSSKNPSDHFMQNGFGGFSYHEGVINKTYQSKSKTSTHPKNDREASSNSRARHVKFEMDAARDQSDSKEVEPRRGKLKLD